MSWLESILFVKWVQTRSWLGSRVLSVCFRKRMIDFARYNESIRSLQITLTAVYPWPCPLKCRPQRYHCVTC